VSFSNHFDAEAMQRLNRISRLQADNAKNRVEIRRELESVLPKLVGRRLRRGCDGRIFQIVSARVGYEDKIALSVVTVRQGKGGREIVGRRLFTYGEFHLRDVIV